MASVAPGARLCAVKVLNQLGQGSFDDMIAGTMHAATVGADVINMSFGVTLPRKGPDTRALVHAVQRAVLSPCTVPEALGLLVSGRRKFLYHPRLSWARSWGK